MDTIFEPLINVLIGGFTAWLAWLTYRAATPKKTIMQIPLSKYEKPSLNHKLKKIFKKGRKSQKRGNFVEAVRYFNLILKKKFDAEVLYERGIAQLKLGNKNKGKDDLKTVVYIAKSTPEIYSELLDRAYNSLGEVLFKEHQYEEAMVNFKKAIKINPGYQKPKRNLKKCRNSLKKAPPAMAFTVKTL